MVRDLGACKAGVLAVAVLAAVAGTVRAERIRPAGEYEQVTLVLPGASEGGRPLTVRLHSRDGELGRGWADGPGGADTRIEHSLERSGDRIVGRLTAVIGPVEYRYRIDARLRDPGGPDLAGTYEGDFGVEGAREDLRGAIHGELRDIPEGGEGVRIEMDFASLYTRWGHIRNPSVRFTLRGGKAVDGEFYSRTSGKRGFDGRLDGGHLSFDDERLRGVVRCRVVGGDAAGGDYAFHLDATVRGGFIDGTTTTRKGGHNWGLRPAFGTAAGPDDPTPADAAYVLTLEEVLTDDEDLALFIECRGGRFGDAVARGGNSLTHAVDASGLAVANGRLNGPVKVDLKAGGGFPPGERDLGCEFDLDAVVSGTKVVGSFAGRYGRREDAKGKVGGTILTAEEIEGD